MPLAVFHKDSFLDHFFLSLLESEVLNSAHCFSLKKIIISKEGKSALQFYHYYLMWKINVYQQRRDITQANNNGHLGHGYLLVKNNAVQLIPRAIGEMEASSYNIPK